jgi:hypothetical protein
LPSNANSNALSFNIASSKATGELAIAIVDTPARLRISLIISRDSLKSVHWR